MKALFMRMEVNGKQLMKPARCALAKEAKLFVTIFSVPMSPVPNHFCLKENVAPYVVI
jgi:hypothetical protein